MNRKFQFKNLNNREMKKYNLKIQNYCKNSEKLLQNINKDQFKVCKN